jgi:hypothetical protein
VERHAQPAPEVRLRGRRPKARSPSRPAAETAGRPRHARTAGAARADLSRTVRSGRLQGLAPPTSPLCLRLRCRSRDTRSFHGLCSSPRSTRAPHQPGRMPGPGRRRTAEAARHPRRRPAGEADAGVAGIPPSVAPRYPPKRGPERTRLPKRPSSARLFSGASDGPGPRPAPSVRPKPSWNAGQCRWSLSGSEVVRRRSPMPVPPRSTPEGVVREAAEPRGGAHRPS